MRIAPCRSAVATYLVCLGLSCSSFAVAQEPTWQDADRAKWLEKNAQIEKKVMVPMRDGVRLATDVYRPQGRAEALPTIFWRTPYNFNELTGTRLKFVHEAVAAGYAFVIQNERGKFFSEGEWEILGFPRTDGWDALDWIADQQWSNGKVGTLGCSSSAEWQMALAAMDHPAHAAMVPMAPGAGVGVVGEYWEQGNWYRGGVEQMFYLTWLYGVQNTQRPRLPVDLNQVDVVRLSQYFDLAPEMPEVDWKKQIASLPLDEAMEKVDGPAGIYQEFMRRRPNDPAWFEGGLWHGREGCGVPALWLFSWYDISTSPNLAMVDHIRRTADDAEVRDNQFVIMAPTLHCAYFRAESPLTLGERVIENVKFPYGEQIFAWFDHWLKDEPNGYTTDTPHNQYFTFGVDQWRSSEQWPPAGSVRRTFFLSSAGGANSLFGDGTLSIEPAAEEQTDRYTYDPLVPTPSLGGGVCCIGDAMAGGVFDQRPIEARADVLVYTSEPLADDFEATGPVEVVLHVSSDAPDTDFTAKLIDVFPDGTAYNLDETIQRVRYRRGYEQEVLLAPGEVVELKLSTMSTSNVFRAGHRIRVEVSSSNFPRFGRNMNTAGHSASEAEPVVAHNAVHHGPEHRSRIVFTTPAE